MASSTLPWLFPHQDDFIMMQIWPAPIAPMSSPANIYLLTTSPKQPYSYRHLVISTKYQLRFIFATIHQLVFHHLVISAVLPTPPCPLCLVISTWSFPIIYHQNYRIW
eukprot:TRINITY_DN7070_c1_g1_i1.p1 TRINITY_DN7070_c1_g1~~TRINITY_DN7070_c1_g1_i1.p1  ORF type:complete len:108 (+),score=0.23 TRINITY_DN7070_c1_g1_i1:46-369(+)